MILEVKIGTNKGFRDKQEIKNVPLLLLELLLPKLN